MPKILIPSEWISRLDKNGQIAELNSIVRCNLGVSNVHGIGVFAIRSIAQGEKCYCTPPIMHRFYNIPFGSLNKLFPEVKKIILSRWASVVNGSVFQNPNDDVGLLFFMNHSYNPNYDVVSDTALRNIAKGEEIFENYCYMQNAEKVYPWLICTNVLNVKQTKFWMNLKGVSLVKKFIKNLFKN